MRTNYQSSYPHVDMGTTSYFSYNVAALASMTNQQLEVSNELYIPLSCLSLLPLLPPRHGAPHSSDPTANCDNSLVSNEPSTALVLHQTVMSGAAAIYMRWAHRTERADR